MPSDTDHLRAALARLAEELSANVTRAETMLDRIQYIRAQLEDDPVAEQVLINEPRPLIVEMVTENLSALQRVGASLRRIEAKTLHRSGMPMEQIAEHFGVTRQRVSSILQEATEPE